VRIWAECESRRCVQGRDGVGTRRLEHEEDDSDRVASCRTWKLLQGRGAVVGEPCAGAIDGGSCHTRKLLQDRVAQLHVCGGRRGDAGCRGGETEQHRVPQGVEAQT
jgi:hypothetical protein